MNDFLHILSLLLFLKTVYASVMMENDYFDIRVSQIEIPKGFSNGTVYLCQEFDAPIDLSFDYDLVKFEVLTQNDPMAHHLLLFACNKESNVEASNLPHGCFSTRPSTVCNEFIAQWSIGMPTTINVHPKTGFRLDKTLFSKFHLQVHLNTIGDKIKSDSIIENSGFRVYYTKTLRSFKYGNVQIGQDKIEIPSQSHQVEVPGKCSSMCTERILTESNVEKIYLTRVYLHMHSLGSKAEFIHISKKNSKSTVLIQELEYNYETPTVYEYLDTDGIAIEPGDEIMFKCYFNSKDGERHRDHMVTFGEGADSEMCYAFVSYYPRIDNFNRCVQYGDQDSCLNA